VGEMVDHRCALRQGVSRHPGDLFTAPGLEQNLLRPSAQINIEAEAN
jgi:hypothetical protein